MFERFTTQAREVVIGARTEATELGHDFVGTEHLLLALLDPRRDGIAYTVLTSAGLTAEGVRGDIQRLLATSSEALGREDAAALEAIGIDLDAVRAKLEETFGPGALSPLPRERRRGLFRRRAAPPPEFGRVRFTARAKKVLELALREAIRLRHNYIGTEHVLLGLLREGEGLAAKVIHDAGVDLDDLRRQTVASLSQAA
jgi:ATP-dependent Clp protease ATP-binding subunit ClpA